MSHAIFWPTYQACVRVMLLAALVGGCRFAPLGSADPSPMVPPGENRPVPALEENPLDPGPIVEVTCTPQGRPLVETEEVRRCAEDADCRIECR